VTEPNFKTIVDTLAPEQAKILSRLRAQEMEQERERLRERQRYRGFDRSR